MNQAIFILIFYFLSASAFASSGSLTSSVDRKTIGEDETLTLEVSYDGSSVSGQPTLSGLDKNFEIINKSTSSETRIINGRYSAYTKWIYTLMPRSTGKLLIPSFEFKGSYSDAIEIHVVSNAQSQNNRDRGDLFIEATVDKPEAYLQEMITLTIKIYTSVQIAMPKLDELHLQDFMVEKIGQSQFEKNSNGRNYYVLQYQYALFATRSGDLSVPKQRYQIAQIISNGPRSLFNIPGFDTQTQARFLSTTEIPLHINPIPADNRVDYWLTGDDVTISDNWPETQNIDMGSSTTRSIEITAHGNLAENIPPLPELQIQGLKVYNEQPTLNNAVRGEDIVSTRNESMAIVPTLAGNFKIPEIRLHWWSPREKAFKVSVLPERHVIVSDNTKKSNSEDTGSQNEPTANPDKNETKNIVPEENIAKQASGSIYQNVYLWIGISTILLLLWFATLMLLIKKQRISPTDNNIHDRNSEQNILKKLKQACRNNDAKAAREMFINWARYQWPQTPPTSLSQIKSLAKNERLDLLLNEMDAAIYRKSQNWDGKKLLEIINTGEINSPAENQNTKLAGLYD